MWGVNCWNMALISVLCSGPCQWPKGVGTGIIHIKYFIVRFSQHTDQLLWNAIQWCAQVNTDVPSTHQYLSTTQHSHPVRPWSSHFSTSHSKQSTAPTFRTFLSASSILKMRAVRCYWTHIIPTLTLLVHRLQNVRESGKFQDSAQQDLRISTATHTTQCKPSAVHSVLCYVFFPCNRSCWSISSIH